MLICAPVAVLATGDSRLTLIIDQDLFYPSYNEDRNYTMGVAAHWTGMSIEQSGITDPLKGLDSVLFCESILDAFSGVAHGVTVASTTFTPENLANPEPIYNDRPYASLLSVATLVRRTDSIINPTKSLTTELTVGLLGLRISEDVQTWIHSSLRAANNGRGRPDPEGWPHQISDGGEPTMMYRVAYDTRCFHLKAADNHDWVQLIPGGELAFGYYTYVKAGGMLRVGYINRNYVSSGTLSDVVVPMKIGANKSAERKNPRSARDRWFEPFELFVFGKASGYAMAYNVMLQGQFRDSDVTVDSEDIERLVSETQVGGMARMGNFGLQYSVYGRSSEFDSDLSRSHYWGSIALSYSMRF